MISWAGASGRRTPRRSRRKATTAQRSPTRRTASGSGARVSRVSALPRADATENSGSATIVDAALSFSPVRGKIPGGRSAGAARQRRTRRCRPTVDPLPINRRAGENHGQEFRRLGSEAEVSGQPLCRFADLHRRGDIRGGEGEAVPRVLDHRLPRIGDTRRQRLPAVHAPGRRAAHPRARRRHEGARLLQHLPAPREHDPLRPGGPVATASTSRAASRATRTAIARTTPACAK
jgi:hypothetical protein